MGACWRPGVFERLTTNIYGCTWAAALDEETDLWPREAGLTLERWRLWWGRRLQALSTEENSDERTRIVATEGAGVVERLLEE